MKTYQAHIFDVNCEPNEWSGLIVLEDNEEIYSVSKKNWERLEVITLQLLEDDTVIPQD